MVKKILLYLFVGIFSFWMGLLTGKQVKIPHTKSGTLEIKELDISVPLYEANVYDKEDNTQAIVDAPNSAAYIQWGDVVIIADHVEQSFASLHEAKEGMQGKISMNGYEKTIECTYSGPGKNKENDIVDNTETSIRKLAKNGVVLYTCTDNWEDITLTIWTYKKG